MIDVDIKQMLKKDQIKETIQLLADELQLIKEQLEIRLEFLENG